VIQRTFQHIPGVGPWREKDLWARGFAGWAAFPRGGEGVAISARADGPARLRIAQAQEALEKRDLAGLAALFPQREHWRLYREFADEAVFFDIETDGRAEQRPTVVSLFDQQGLHVFIEGRNMQELPAALMRRRLWVTFNGSCFDVPVLRSHFPQLGLPAAHLDLRFIYRRLGHGCGLKALEDRFALPRPLHLRGADGWDAVLLWRAYRHHRDLAALRFLVEYNLYDAFNLRTLMDLAYNLGVDGLNQDAPKAPVFERGDVLYDVSRTVLALAPVDADPGVLERARAVG
jgi:uncharacterized protein YprB with RNaseH-like and TPR domain